MIDEKKLIEDILQHENVLASANHVYKSGYRDRQVEIIDIINRQPKVGEWIPVSERLPDDGETYLITNAESFEQYHTYKGWYDGTKGIWHMTGNFERKMNVIAWMPLPEPYKEKQNA